MVECSGYFGFGEEVVHVLETGASTRQQHFHDDFLVVELPDVNIAEGTSTDELLGFDLVAWDSLGDDDFVVPEIGVIISECVE